MAAKTNNSQKADEASANRVRAQGVVDQFIAQHLRNSDFSRDTPAWNHFQAGVPALVDLIEQAMEG